MREEACAALNGAAVSNQPGDLSAHVHIWHERAQLGSLLGIFLSHPSTAVSIILSLSSSPFPLSLCLMLSLLSAFSYSYEWSVLPGHSSGACLESWGERNVPLGLSVPQGPSEGRGSRGEVEGMTGAQGQGSARMLY